MAQADRLGQAMVHRALAKGMPWGGEDLQEYVNRLGQNLARASGSRQTLTFYVLYDPQVNAQAFPGGYVLVNTGAIGSAESEAELASVLAHEIAHINACDCQTPLRKSHLLAFVALVPAMALAGPAGLALTAGGGLVVPLARARLSRSAERGADRLAVEYLVRAGYDPHAVVAMLARTERAAAGEAVSRGLLATHPRTSDRQKYLEDIASSMPPPGIVPHDDTEFRRMQKAVRDYDEIYAQAIHTRAARKPTFPFSRPAPEKALPD